MNIAIYVRVSTEEQAKHGYSLEHQITSCKEQANKDNLNIDFIFNEYVDDGYSGEYLERPSLIKLREDVRCAFIDKIYCYDPDRLSRKLMHQLLLDEELNKHCTLLFVNGEYEKTPEGKLFYQLRGAVAEFEKAKINERMSNGRKTKAKKGMVIKNNFIYGYDYNKENGQLIINENEAKIVRFIFDSFTAKTGKFKGINGIALYLSQSGIPTKKGKDTWHRQVVRQILMSSTYTGKFTQNKWNTEGMLGNKFKKDNKIKISKRPEEEWIIVPCPIIIEQAQFDFAQKLLQTSRRRWSGTSKNQYLLSGLVRCNECRNTMVGRRTKNWGTYIFLYSDIKNTAGAKNKGCGNKIKCSKLDKEVLEDLLEWLNNFKDSDGNETEDNVQSSYEKDESIRISKILKEKETARKQFIKSISQGKIIGLTQEEINEELLDSQKEINNLKKVLIELEKQTQMISSNKDRKTLIKESLKSQLETNPNDWTFEETKEFIRFVAQEITVNKEGKFKIYTI
jgi:site-specific DNA recombinase